MYLLWLPDNLSLKPRWGQEKRVVLYLHAHVTTHHSSTINVMCTHNDRQVTLNGFCLFGFETGSHCGVLAGLKLSVNQPGLQLGNPVVSDSQRFVLPCRVFILSHQNYWVQLIYANKDYKNIIFICCLFFVVKL